jgi:hypothetical protein
MWWIAFTCLAFVVQLFVPPPYRIAPEDTLLYRDYVILHQKAAAELAAKHPNARILTAWPASDELTRPFLGYVKQPLTVVRIENFSPLEMERAAQASDEFDVAYLFSSKWEPPHPLFSGLTFGKPLQERFFDYHETVTPRLAAEMLSGRIVRYQNRNNEWIALLSIEKIQDAWLHSNPRDCESLSPEPNGPGLTGSFLARPFDRCPPLRSSPHPTL